MRDQVMPNRRMLMAVVKYYFKRNNIPSLIAFVDQLQQKGDCVTRRGGGVVCLCGDDVIIGGDVIVCLGGVFV